MKKFNVTIVKSQNPANLTKRISYIDGQIKKTTVGNIISGVATLKSFDLQSFTDYLNNISEDECVVSGRCNHSNEVEIVGHNSLENIPAKKMCNP